MLAYCYYPLCWVLFISTLLLNSFTRKFVNVITHYVGFFSFLRKQNLIWIWNWNVITHYVGFFSFLLVKLSAKHIHVYRYYPLCWVLFISTLTKSNLKKAGKCYYPLCWVLFISTNLTATIDTTTMLLPTMLGSFHFYRCWKTRSVSSIVITHYVGFFSFLRYPFRSPVKSRLSKGIFVSIYLNILKKEFFNHFFVLVKILG